MGTFFNFTTAFVLLLSILIGIINLEIPAVNEFLVLRSFSKYRDGIFCIEMPNGNIFKFGDLPMATDAPEAICDNTMTIVNKDLTFQGILQGSVGIGRAYFEGHWEAAGDQDLGDLFTHLLWNVKTTTTLASTIFRYLRIWDWNEYFQRSQLTKDKVSDKSHVRKTYFNTKFFEYMLDASMTYTCALWNEKTNTLFEAQMNKINILLHKLRINSDSDSNAVGIQSGNILDVGSGWGFLSSYIHNLSSSSAYNVTGITIADEQFNYAQNRFGNNNDQSPHYLLLDFRDLFDVFGENFFDGIISVGVISHIHMKRLNEWFEVLYKVLKPGGYFVMQGITATQALNIYLQDDHFVTKSAACKGYNFMGKYIFPGGCVLLGDWLQESGIRAGFISMHREYIGQHYSRTLHEWRMNMYHFKEEILGHDVLNGNLEYYRMYEFFLAHCEAAYRTGVVEKTHFVFYKPKNLPYGEVIHTKKYSAYKNNVYIPMLDKYKY